MKHKRIYRNLGRAFYIISAALLITSLVFNFIPAKVTYADDNPDTQTPPTQATSTDDGSSNLLPPPVTVTDDGSGTQTQAPDASLTDTGTATDTPSPDLISTDPTDPAVTPSPDGSSTDSGNDTLLLLPLGLAGPNANDPTPDPSASVSYSIGDCTFTVDAGSLTSVTITIVGARVKTGSVAGNLTDTTTLSLAPGDYSFDWDAVQGYTGSGTISFSITSCDPPLAPLAAPTTSTAHVDVLVCHATGSSTNPYTSVVVDVGSVNDANGLNGHGHHANDEWNSFVFDNVTYPGQPANDNQLVDNGCNVPTPASVDVSVGECSYTPASGSLTPVTFTIVGAELDTSPFDGILSTTTTLNMPPGTYTFTWTAIYPAYTGSGTITFTVPDCTPKQASVAFALGDCQYSVDTKTSQTAVTITIVGAVVHTGTVAGDLTTTTTLYLPPGNYSFPWDAAIGYTGSGTITFSTLDCSPGIASAAFVIGDCRYSVDTNKSLTAVTINISNAVVHTGSVAGDLTTTTTLDLAPGNYSFPWEALTGFTGSGTLTFTVGDCTPPPAQPSVQVVCYSLAKDVFNLTVTNSGPSGEVGYSTDLAPTIVSLGVMANGASVGVQVPGNTSSFTTYAMFGGSWQTVGTISLSKQETNLCEPDPLTVSGACSYQYPAFPIQWTVTNTGSFTVSFDWTYGPDSSSSSTSLPAGSSAVFFTAFHSGDTMEIFVNGILLASATAPDCSAFIPLTVKGVCTKDPNSDEWIITNNNPDPTNYEYSASGGASGTGTIPGNSSVTIFTPKVSNADTISVYSGGILQESAASPRRCGETGGTPPPGTSETPVVLPPVVTITGTPQTIIIPVTGIDLGAASKGLPGTFLNLGFGFLGVGLVCTGISRKKDR